MGMDSCCKCGTLVDTDEDLDCYEYDRADFLRGM